jgi:hypothetical protein
MSPMQFLNKYRRKVRDTSPDQIDGQGAAMFSTAGSYGIQTLAEPENISVEYDVRLVALIILINNA